jgi:hypothetical protein
VRSSSTKFLLRAKIGILGLNGSGNHPY